MEWPVALIYPNGRVHETTIDAPPDFGPGYEFEAFGRRWRASDPPRSSARRRSTRTLCECIGRSLPRRPDEGETTRAR